jgi:hypothetical protein
VTSLAQYEYDKGSLCDIFDDARVRVERRFHHCPGIHDHCWVSNVWPAERKLRRFYDFRGAYNQGQR